MSKKSGKKKAKEAVEFIAPDGGWGWVIVVGAGISNIVVIPLIQSFGLIFIDRFNELNFSSTDITLIITFNSWFGMVLGIFNGPLLKRFGFRKMALMGVTLFTIGFFFTGLATERFHFLISYGMVASVGFTLIMQSFAFAINTYFKKRRSFAAGKSSFLTAIGPIVMPILISFLLQTYGVKWTVFILAALNMNAYVGALLLQPVQWHVKKPPEETKIILEEKELFGTKFEEEEEVEQTPVECDTYSLLGGMASSLAGSKKSLNRRMSSISFNINRRSSGASCTRRPSGISSTNWVSQDSLLKIKQKRLDSLRSKSESESMKKGKSITKLDNEDHEEMLKSMLNLLEKPVEEPDILEEPAECEKLEADVKLLASVESLNDGNGYILPTDQKIISISSIDEAYSRELESGSDDSKPEPKKKRPWWLRFWRYIKKLYDLDLLTDPIYINITVGMSIAIIGEMIFSLLTPFILDEVGLDLNQKAYFMSVVAFTDLAFRYIAPYVGAKLKFGSRAMYVTALFLLLITRACMFIPRSFEGYLVVAAGLGIGKGFRTVFWGLVIPDYVPLPKYPSASAIQMLANGILLAVSGPIIGAVVSISNSYTDTIIMSNILTMVTVVMWYTEFAIIWFRDRRKRKENKKAELENK